MASFKNFLEGVVLYLIAFMFVVGLVFAIVKMVMTEADQKDMAATTKTVADFHPTFEYYAIDGKTGIAVDDERGKILLVTTNGLPPRMLSHKDIFSSEIIENGRRMTQTVRSSQMAGALVGGVVLGGVGAIAGGLSGKRAEKTKVSQILVRLTVNDPARPLHDLSFLDVETAQGGFVYTTAMNAAQQWHARMEVLIRRADTDEASVVSNVANISCADELRKLAELHASGILTDAEFAAQKLRLLT